MWRKTGCRLNYTSYPGCFRCSVNAGHLVPYHRMFIITQIRRREVKNMSKMSHSLQSEASLCSLLLGHLTTPSLAAACRFQASEISRLVESWLQHSPSVLGATTADLVCPIWLRPCDPWLAPLSKGLKRRASDSIPSTTRPGDPCRAKGGWSESSPSCYCQPISAPLWLASGFATVVWSCRKWEVAAKSQGIPDLTQC